MWSLIKHQIPGDYAKWDKVWHNPLRHMGDYHWWQSSDHLGNPALILTINVIHFIHLAFKKHSVWLFKLGLSQNVTLPCCGGCYTSDVLLVYMVGYAYTEQSDTCIVCCLQTLNYIAVINSWLSICQNYCNFHHIALISLFLSKR